MSGEFGSARQEAERLVATVLAMAQQATAGLREDKVPAEEARPEDRYRHQVHHDEPVTATGARMIDGFVTLGSTLAGMTGLADKDKPKGFATGSVECCICPVCRTMRSMRNPTPEKAARLATGAGDLASGVASFMRAFAGGSAPAPPRPARTTPDPDLMWSAATRAGDPPPAQPKKADPDGDPWAAATDHQNR